MIEQIRKTTGNHNGTVTYWIADNEKGIPYASVLVYQNGDYSKHIYGSFSFGRLCHDKILQVAQPTGNDVTYEKYQESKKKH